MKSPQDVYDLLHSVGIVLENNYGRYKERPVRLIDDYTLQVGDSYFDRWANSLSISFNLMEARTQQDFLDWAEHFEGGPDEDYYEDEGVIL